MSKLGIFSETGPLETVVIGWADNFHAVAPEAVNETQRRYYGSPGHPQRERIIEEYAEFVRCLAGLGIEVLQPVPVSDVPDQLSPRDIGFVIGTKLVISRMVWASRHSEWRGLEQLLASIPAEQILRAPVGAYVEGGDIVVDRGRVYVGVGQRTSPLGVEFVREEFPEFEVLGVELRSLNEGEDVVHLDCSFLPIGKQSALIYKAGFRHLPREILENYDLIEVTQEEQRRLAVNVLSVSAEMVISQHGLGRVNTEMRKRGVEVLEVDFSETIKTGGSFHCGSMPLSRAI